MLLSLSLSLSLGPTFLSLFSFPFDLLVPSSSSSSSSSSSAIPVPLSVPLLDRPAEISEALPSPLPISGGTSTSAEKGSGVPDGEEGERRPSGNPEEKEFRKEGNLAPEPEGVGSSSPQSIDGHERERPLIAQEKEKGTGRATGRGPENARVGEAGKVFGEKNSSKERSEGSEERVSV